MILEFDNRNVLPFVSKFGVKRNDLDGPNTGRTMDGTMYRDRVASKDTIEIECIDLHTIQARDILTMIKPDFIQVRYTSPEVGERVAWFYCSNVSIGLGYVDDYGYEMWSGISFTLIER